MEENGYSLLEFLFASTITLGVTAIAIPELHELRKSILLDYEARKIQALIERTQTKAILTQERFILTFQERTLHVQSESRETMESLHLSPTSNITFPRDGISLYPHQANQPARILLYFESNFCEITLSLRGRIRRSCR